MKLLAYIASVAFVFIACTSAARADAETKTDSSCTRVNHSYYSINIIQNYSISTYQMQKDKTLKPFQEYRTVDGYYYTKYAFSTNWLAHGRAYVSLMDRTGPTFTSCKILGRDGNLAHYSATWHEFPYSASAQIWIDLETNLLVKMSRRYPDKLWEFPFAAVLDVYEYYHSGKPELDPSCADINNAYDGKHRPRQYSVTVYEMSDRGSTKPYALVRFDNGEYYTKSPLSSDWVKRGRANISTITESGPVFTSCKFLGEEPSVSGTLLHYAAIWQKAGEGAAMEIWISKNNPRLIKAIRRYADDHRQFEFPTAMEVYDYGPLSVGLEAPVHPEGPVAKP